jgi:hypothetical protein
VGSGSITSGGSGTELVETRWLRKVYEQPVDSIEVALASTADDPLVAPAVARVTRLGVRLLRDIFVGLGL